VNQDRDRWCVPCRRGTCSIVGNRFDNGSSDVSVPYAHLSDAEFVAAVDRTLQKVWRELVAEEFGAAAGVSTK
jgi:hypothetical protein